MSHVNSGLGSGTCQWCKKPVQSGRVGTVRRHKLPSGNYCPGGGCLSVETKAEEAPDMAPIYAWCFSHGTLHQFDREAEPWCTASWTPLAGLTKEQAMEAKAASYGDAQFLDQLTSDQQLQIIEICDARDRPVTKGT